MKSLKDLIKEQLVKTDPIFLQEFLLSLRDLFDYYRNEMETNQAVQIVVTCEDGSKVFVENLVLDYEDIKHLKKEVVQVLFHLINKSNKTILKTGLYFEDLFVLKLG